MIKVKQWCKSNGLNKTINEVATEAEAIDFVTDLLSDFEKEETKRLQNLLTLLLSKYIITS